MSTLTPFTKLIDRPQVVITDYLRIHAGASPDAPCFVDHTGDSRTFRQVDDAVNVLANWLLRAGMVTGDRVAVLALDSVDYMVTILACMRIGVIVVPLNYRLNRAEVEVLLTAAEPTFLFHSTRYTEFLAGIQTVCPSIKQMYTFADEEHAGTLASSLDPGDTAAPSVMVDDDTIALCIFTSGTTGSPKAVLQSNGMLKAFVITLLMEYQLTPHEFRYVASPIFHIGGLAVIFMGIMRGYPHLLLPQFEPQTALRWMGSGRLTSCTFVPTMISTLLKEPSLGDGDYSGVRTIVYGAGPITPDLIRRATAAFDCDFVQAFGAGTEAGLQTVLRAADHRRALSGDEHLLTSVGKPAFGVELRICDDDWNDVPRGQVGEIVTRSEAFMSGYWGRPEDTNAIIRDGWIRGGDAGWQDDEGYLYLGSRKKDIIVRGGVNIYPLEIETVLCDHPSIADASVVGRPDPEWGEVVVAFVIADPDHSLDEAELRRHCGTRLATYKTPVEFVELTAFPKNASGKVLKRALREHFEQ